MIYSDTANHKEFKYSVPYRTGYINTNNEEYAYKLAFLLSTTCFVRDYNKDKWKFISFREEDIKVGYV